MTVEVVSKRAGYVEREGDCYIGRPGPWGNPFAIGKDGTRAEVIEKFRAYIEARPDLVQRLRARAPQRLVCWCAPRACHGDVLAEILQSVPGEQ